MQSVNPHINAGFVDDDLYKSYYANKINILHSKQQYDSALSVAKMEDDSQYSIYKYEAAYRISELFHEKGCEDSAYKYLSIYNHYMDTNLVRQQETMLQKYLHQTDIMNGRRQIEEYKKEAKYRKNGSFIVILCSFFTCLYFKLRKHKKYENATKELKKKSLEIHTLESSFASLKKESKENEAIISKLKEELLLAKRDMKGITQKIPSDMLFKERLAAILQTKAMKQWQELILHGAVPTKELYNQMLEDVHVIAPDTYDLLCNKAYIKDKNVQQFCLLIIFQTKSKLISTIFRWTPQLVCNLKSRLNDCIFNKKSAQSFAENLLTYKP